MNKLLIRVRILFFIGQALQYGFRPSGQFVWPWFKKEPPIINFSNIMGTTISYVLIYATKIHGMNTSTDCYGQVDSLLLVQESYLLHF